MDDLEATRGGDEATRLAQLLPVMSIAKLLGVDSGDWQQLKQWSLVTSGLASCPAATYLREVTSFYGYFGRATRDRRNCPLEDLISNMVEQNELDTYLNDTDLKTFCVLLLTSGNETTTNLMCNTLNILTTHPGVWRQLKEGHLSADAVAEQAVRFESPIQLISRVAKRGVSIRDWQFRNCNELQRMIQPQIVNDRRPAQLQHPQRIGRRFRCVGRLSAIAHLTHRIARTAQRTGDLAQASAFGQALRISSLRTAVRLREPMPSSPS